MRKQLQGIALILSGILLVLIAMVDPWLPIIGWSEEILLLAGSVFGVAGLAFCFQRHD